jgi:hypothetical protein
MGKGQLARDAKLLQSYTGFLSDEIVKGMVNSLAGVPLQIAKIIATGMEEEDYVDKFISKAKKQKAEKSPDRKEHKKKQKADNSPVRKEDKKKKKKSESKKDKAEAPKAAKKRKDPNAPKGARNAKTMFKIDRAADLTGLSRDERFKKEGALYKALSDAERKKYDDMAAEDKKRHARETELYKAGKFVPGVKAVAELKKEIEPKKEEETKAPKKKKAAVEEEKKDESSSDEDSFSLGADSD